MHSNKWFKKNFTRDRMMEGLEICRDCHSAIHQAIEEKSLARNYNTLEALRSHPEVSKFIDWVSNKDTNRVPMRSWRERKKSRR